MIEYTVKVYPNGDKSWYLNGKCHREDGPAVEWSDGDKSWYLNGKCHRIEYANGNKFWYLNGELHREDGPAIEYTNGYKSWYLNDKEYTEQQFNEKMNPKANEVPDCYVYIYYDEEYNIFDVEINIFGDTTWIKEFDVDDENLAVDYSKKVSDHFGIQYLGFFESNNFTLKEAAKV